MREFFFVALMLLLLQSCAAVVTKDMMETGIRDFSLQELTRSPEQYKGKRFILGGAIATTGPTEQGCLIDALYVPVDSSGRPRDVQPDGRFLALYPKELGALESARYSRNRRITLAGIFTGVQADKVGQMDRPYPAFRIEQIHLWPRDSRNPGSSAAPQWGPPYGPPLTPYGLPYNYW